MSRNGRESVVGRVYTVAAAGLVAAWALLTPTAASGAQDAAPDGAQDPAVRSFPVGAQPNIVFDGIEGSIDLGYIPISDEPFEQKIEMLNYGTEPYTIGQWVTGCSCTEFEFSSLEIPPGESVEMTIRHIEPNHPERIRRMGRIQMREMPQHWLQVRIEAEIGWPVRARVGDHLVIQRPQGELLLTAMDDEPFRILAVGGKPAPERAGGEGLVGDEARTQHRLAFDLEAGDGSLHEVNGVALSPRAFVVETDHPDAPIVLVPNLWAEAQKAELTPSPRSWVADPGFAVARVEAGETIQTRQLLRRTPLGAGGEAPSVTVQSYPVEREASKLEVSLVGLAQARMPSFFDAYVDVTVKPGTAPGLVHEFVVLQIDETRFTAFEVFLRVGDPSEDPALAEE
jgi:hypothetical protein